MTYQLIVGVLLLVVSISLGQNSTVQKSLSQFGKHLTVTYVEYPQAAIITRNASGNFIKAEGVSPLMIDWLSHRYQFTYSVLDIGDLTIESIPGKRGQASYLLSGENDLIMAAIVGTEQRQRYMELIHPWTFMPIAFIVPMPNTSYNNVDAIIKPFQLEVWIAFALSAVSVILILSCSNRSLKSDQKQKVTVQCQWRRIWSNFSTSNATTYVLGTILNQGGYIPNKKIRIRLVIGAWCLMTFVLLNVYNGVLTSYMTTTRQDKPIINSIEDAAYDPSIQLVVNKGWGPDYFISTSVSGLYKVMGDKLRAYQKSRCNLTEQCIEMVKTLPGHVYINGLIFLQNVIYEDYHKTNRCSLLITAKVPLLGNGNIALSWALAKNSRYLEEFNRGTLYLREVGLIPLWEKWFSPNLRPCMNDDHQIVNSSKLLLRLSLTNMAGPFALLGIGGAISIVVFLIELINGNWNKRTVVKRAVINI